jgi:threonine dehydrogenase-like Zn-dependent dehydrogenase
MTDPLPMLTLFDRQIQLRIGQANVRRWVDDLLPLLGDGDPRGVSLGHLPPSARGAPDAYSSAQKKQDGVVKVLFRPRGPRRRTTTHRAAHAAVMR